MFVGYAFLTCKSVVNTFQNKYGGLTEEELCTRGLPDYLREGLEIVFVGINPGLAAAYSGRYYSGPGNHFWQALYLSGLIPRPMSFEDDHKGGRCSVMLSLDII